MARIFISHSHSDEAIAFKLSNFLSVALSLKPKEIFCSSNPDQGLDLIPTSITDQLKNRLKNSEALIILITADSLHSAWIPFEAGSFWTTDKTIIPILGPGLTQNDLLGPLKNLLIIPIEAQDLEDRLNNATNQLAKNLNLQQEFTRWRKVTLQEFSDSLRAWQSKRPVPNQSQQEEIERLKAKIEESENLHQSQIGEKESEIARLQDTAQSQQAAIEDLTRKLVAQERSHEQKLEEMKAASQHEKEELERNYQNQKQELEQSLQSLQSKIQQLEEHLDQERSQEVKQKETDTSQTQHFTEDLGNGIKLEMIAIPGGTFMMGSPEGEGYDSEKPQHEVTVSPFFMGKFEVTQAQWKAIASLPKVNRDLELDPSSFNGDERPVEKVSWDDAVEFCQRLSKQTGKEYRLPTEAEWEYACRAGTTTPYYFGKTIIDELANYNRNVGETTAVGKYPPNAFGLYDMHGNVWEWCEDDWHKNYQDAPSDGKAWVTGNSSKKVTRGGS